VTRKPARVPAATKPKTSLRVYKYIVQVHLHEVDARGKVIGESSGEPVQLFGDRLDGALARKFDRMTAKGIQVAMSPGESG